MSKNDEISVLPICVAALAMLVVLLAFTNATKPTDADLERCAAKSGMSTKECYLVLTR